MLGIEPKRDIYKLLQDRLSGEVKLLRGSQSGEVYSTKYWDGYV